MLVSAHPYAQNALDQEKRVAILISSYADQSRPELSYDLEELAQAYLVLSDNGIKVDIISPKGGAVLVKTHKDKLAYIQRFKQEALHKLENTIAVQNVNQKQYDGILIVGGSGAMLDLPKDKATQALLTQFARNNSPIAAVCHGPAAIVDIKLKNGSFLVEGKQVNSFTNAEEFAFSADHLDKFPFLIEDKLIENGATFVHNTPMLPYVSVDGNLITAQNPSSVPKAAEALVLKLGVQLKTRELFKDEATMRLIAEARNNGATLIDIALATSPKKYDIDYLALYGFYAYKLAESEEAKRKEINIMVAIANHFQHPMYEVELIKALVEQGLTSQAQSAFVLFSTRYPEHNMLNTLSLLLNSKA
jgi:putative intracellular protease/amidase